MVSTTLFHLPVDWGLAASPLWKGSASETVAKGHHRGHGEQQKTQQGAVKGDPATDLDFPRQS